MEFLLAAKILFALVMVVAYVLLTWLVIHFLREYPNDPDTQSEGSNRIREHGCAHDSRCPIRGQSFRSVGSDDAEPSR